MRLVLAVAAVLVFASLQCASSCTFLEAAPPCHHHGSGEAMNACSHEIVMDRAPELVSAAPVAAPADGSLVLEAIVFEAPVHAATFFAPPAFVLRI